MPFIRKSVKFGRARQATDDNITRRMRTACGITKGTETFSKYVMFIAFNNNNDYTDEYQYYVSRTLLALSRYISITTHHLRLRLDFSVHAFRLKYFMHSPIFSNSSNRRQLQFLPFNLP